MTTIAVHPIKTQEDLTEAIERAYSLRQAPEGSQEADEYLVLLDLIEAYESRHHPLANLSPIELVTFLMEQNGLSQAQLPEIGPQPIVSAVLAGKRKLNARMAMALAKRFHVQPTAFLDAPHQGL